VTKIVFAMSQLRRHFSARALRLSLFRCRLNCLRLPAPLAPDSVVGPALFH
jgi:hypothetical protein